MNNPVDSFLEVLKELSAATKTSVSAKLVSTGQLVKITAFDAATGSVTYHVVKRGRPKRESAHYTQFSTV